VLLGHGLARRPQSACRPPAVVSVARHGFDITEGPLGFGVAGVA
jgi:hypothetical protein